MKHLFVPVTLGFILFLTLAPLSGQILGTAVSPETLAERLDGSVSLTADQKARIIALFQKQEAVLKALPAQGNVDAPVDVDRMQDRFKRMLAIHTATRAEVRALLTPEQQVKFDHISQLRGGGQTQNTLLRVARLDDQVGLTTEQKKLATDIYDEEYEELLAFPPEERMMKGREARLSSKALIDAMLTPEQQRMLESIQAANTKKYNDDKKEIMDLLKSSAAVAMRVGTIGQLTLVNSYTHSDSQKRVGKATYKVTGEHGTDVFTIYWERSQASGPAQLIKVEGPNGELLQP